MRVERHYSDNSIGIRFRSLRVLYNSAITDGLIKKTDYPFDTFKVSRFKEATAKRSLTKEDIRRIMDCEVRTLTKYPKPFLQLAKDLFLFSYLSCGINLTDILHIRYADIVDGGWFSTARKRVNSCRSNSNPPHSTFSTSTANRTHIRRITFSLF